MSEQNDAQALEASLLTRAQQLAEEERQLGEQECQRLLQSARLRLEQRRQQIEAQARQQAERHFRQQVQRAELAQAAKLEQLRWTLIESVYANLANELQQLAERPDDYRDLLIALLREGCQAIADGQLIAQLNNRDLSRYRAEWPALLTEAHCDKTVTLSEDKCDCSGGVLLYNASGDTRFDNTVEGRLARLRPALQQTIGEHLFNGIDSDRMAGHAG